MRILKMALDEARIEMPEPITRVYLRRLPAEVEHRETFEPPHGISVKEEGAHTDVARETYLDRQIDKDKASSDEENLLGE